MTASALLRGDAVIPAQAAAVERSPALERAVPRGYLYFSPEGLSGAEAYAAVCELIGLQPSRSGYGALLLEDTETGERTTLVARDRAWIDGIAAMRRAERGTGSAGRDGALPRPSAPDRQRSRYAPDDVADGLHVDPAVLRTKCTALLDGWPDDWLGRAPRHLL